MNLGKGAILKTGLNCVSCNFADTIGVVALDADGQHLPADADNLPRILEKHRESLVLGVRASDGSAPLRCRFGNAFTRTLSRMLTGEKLSGTQSGLRGIPKSMIPMPRKLNADRYQFELDMLLACTYTGRQIIGEPIGTVFLSRQPDPRLHEDLLTSYSGSLWPCSGPRHSIAPCSSARSSWVPAFPPARQRPVWSPGVQLPVGERGLSIAVTSLAIREESSRPRLGGTSMVALAETAHIRKVAYSEGALKIDLGRL